MKSALVMHDHPPDKSKESPTLNQLLIALSNADEELSEFDPNQQLDLMEAGKVKVDNYKYILDKLEAQEFYLSAREKEFTAARKAIQSHIRKLKDNLLFALQNNGFEKFTGHQFIVSKRRAAPAVEIIAGGDPTALHMMKFSDYIRIKYEWNKEAIRLNIGKDPLVDELATMRETYYTRFSPNKEPPKSEEAE